MKYSNKRDHMKKIVILNGSNSNKLNTAGLIRAFTEGAESAGNEVTQFDVTHMNIHGCLGCMKCLNIPKNAPNICVIDDDMKQIYDAVMEADVIVFASPVYWWGPTGQLKIAVDRLNAVTCHAGLEFFSRKSTALLMTFKGGGMQAALSWYSVFRLIVGCRDLGAVIGIGRSKENEAYHLGASI